VPAGRVGGIVFTSSHAALQRGFAWAKQTALGYVSEGDPVGSWFEAALPGREAFCMRDVAHQTRGALALGLRRHTRNMLHKFALGIAASRQWASYWEIDRHDRPAPVDYRSDADFWYNLPANFDVVSAAWRAFQWTGDRTYVDAPEFDAFYRHSLTSYVHAWDADGDGIMESSASNGPRGIPTYWEGDGPRALTGADLVAAQFAGNRAYASMLRFRDGDAAAAPFAAAATRLRRTFNERWWNESAGRFYAAIRQGGSFDESSLPLAQIYALYFGIVPPGEHRRRVLDTLSSGGSVELDSYVAEVYWAGGRPERAFEALMAQVDPQLPRREYPENSFTVIGTVTAHLMGIHPRASEAMVETVPALPRSVAWARLDGVPVLANELAVRHDGNGRTRLTNVAGPSLHWRAVVTGDHGTLLVNGHPCRAQHRLSEWGTPESFVELDVDDGQTLTVAVPSTARNTRSRLPPAIAATCSSS